MDLPFSDAANIDLPPSDATDVDLLSSDAEDVDLLSSDTAEVALKTLIVAKVGAGAGKIISNPSGINCGTTCSKAYANGTRVTLTVTPAQGSTFAGWGGACSGTGTCRVLMDAGKKVTARFNTKIQTETLKVSKTGSGTVTSEPAGINCGATCSKDYEKGIKVILTAVPAQGNSFGSWSGGPCLSAYSYKCTVSMDFARNVTANFITGTTQTLTVSKAGTGSGTVTSYPAGIDCGSACTKSYTNQTAVSLKVIPAAGSVFAGWSGNCSGLYSCAFQMNAPKNVTATFNKIQ
ncbi:MAG: hypothetical protein IPN70_02970 [Candidatus Moraniibacteriota bacterium]|nr:MAG: hypothetical protein IPN70_02970 [Candidatus Moranbacteria bacterium]